MNREIKFRGKRLDTGEWVYGDLLHYTDGSVDIRVTAEKKQTGEFAGKPFYSIAAESHEIDPATVGQYIGLDDKNDEEIYEGDVVSATEFQYDGSDKPFRGVVAFHCGEWQIWPNSETEFWGPDGSPSLFYIRGQDDEFEVIGNVHDTPELLEAK